MIKPTHRNMGLGAKLLDAVVHHPKLQTIEYFDLFCLPEMIPFYERWGFSADMASMVPMRRQR
jgi:GNAT superfamily N-acetyltransferase